MSPMIVIGIVLATASLLWAIEFTRDLIVRANLSDEVERSITVVLPALVLSCFLWLGYVDLAKRVPDRPDHSEKKKQVADRKIIDKPSPTFVDVLRGDVQTEAGKKLPDAQVKLGQDETRTREDGSFELGLSSRPQPDGLVRVMHDGYITRFFRFDDPVISAHKKIALQPKMRLIVLERTLPDDRPSENTILVSARSALEKNLKCNEIEVLADPDIRSDALHELARYQRERALYDPSMVQDIGKFHGATHAVFYRISRNSAGHPQMEATLVNLATTKVLSLASEPLTDAQALESIAATTSARLLADLTTVEILSPKDSSHAGRQVEAEGFVAYLPPGWKLCLTLVPHNLQSHFPQEQPTINDDGSWFGSEVYLGDAEQPEKQLKYRLNAMITRGGQSDLIATYLSTRQSGGLRRDLLRQGEYKVLDHVDLLRDR